MSNPLIIHPFEPVFNEHSKVLILGSFPSVVSREKNFYYANRNNRFWPVMEILFSTEITDRKLFCLDHGIALWDVIRSCRISGSSDASITDVTANDIAGLIKKTKIRTVFTTGKKSTELYEKYVACDAEHIGLPSTSSANARMRIDDLVKEYRIIAEKLNEES